MLVAVNGEATGWCASGRTNVVAVVLDEVPLEDEHAVSVRTQVSATATFATAGRSMIPF
jgi:hypothetical protein